MMTNDGDGDEEHCYTLDTSGFPSHDAGVE